MKIRAEVADEQSLLFISDCNLCGHSMDPAALIALGVQVLQVSVALDTLLLALVPKLRDRPYLPGRVPSCSCKGLNILNDIFFFYFPKVLLDSFAPRRQQTRLKSWKWLHQRKYKEMKELQGADFLVIPCSLLLRITSPVSLLHESL